MAETKSTASAPKASTPAAETAAPAKGGSKALPILLIVGCVVLLLCAGIGVVGFMLAKKAQEKVAEDVVNNSLENIIEDSIEKDSGKDSDVNFGGTLPSSFPKDVPVYPGAKVGFSSSTDGDNGGKDITATFTSSDSAQKVIDYYKSKIEAEGWDVTGEGSIFGIYLQAEKDSRELYVSALDSTDKDTDTYITVTITSK